MTYVIGRKTHKNGFQTDTEIYFPNSWIIIQSNNELEYQKILQVLKELNNKLEG